MNQTYAKDYTKGFEIYLHEKNQFWPGLEMRRTGQTDPIFIPTKREMWGTFKVVQKSKHPRQSAPCVEDPDYSFTQCMMEYVANTAGCHLDWVNPGPFNSIIMAVRYTCCNDLLSFKEMVATNYARAWIRSKTMTLLLTQSKNCSGNSWSMLPAASPSVTTKSSALRRYYISTLWAYLRYLNNLD